MKRLIILLLRYVIFVLMIIINVNTAAIAQTSRADEQLFKAAFIYNFAKYTNWPEDLWQAHSHSLNLCTAGNDKLVGELMRLAGKTIKNRLLAILPLDDIHNHSHCHLLYIAISEKQHYQTILSTLGDEPILTVSEITDFGRTGGIIELYREQGRTRFLINTSVADEKGLTFSSRLLILAVVINDEVTP